MYSNSTQVPTARVKSNTDRRARGTRPTGYPVIPIAFQAFRKIISSLLVNPINDIAVDVALFDNYLESQYTRELSIVKLQGYETVLKWAQAQFADWKMETHGNQLK